MGLRFFHVFSWLDNSFLFNAEEFSIFRICHSLSIYLLKDINICVWAHLGGEVGWGGGGALLYVHKFSTPLGLIPRTVITGLYDKYMFSFVKKLPNSLPMWIHHFAFPSNG